MERNETERDLQTLTADLLDLGGLVQEAFQQATVAVRRPEKAHHRHLAESHRQIVGRRAGIEAASMALLGRYNLPPSELRQIACIIEIAAELERITFLLRKLVRTPLLTYGETSKRATAAAQLALESTAANLAGVLFTLSTGPPLPATLVGGRVALQFAVAYEWVTDDIGAALARPYLRRQLVNLAQSYREIINHIVTLAEWTIFFQSNDVTNPALPIHAVPGMSRNTDD